jgi:hypothetical protein
VRDYAGFEKLWHEKTRERLEKASLRNKKPRFFSSLSPFFFLFSFKNHALARIIVGRGQAKENAI